MPLDILNTEGVCPGCTSRFFIIGPRGGTAVNIKCVMCNTKYWFCPPFTPEVIENGDEFYTAPPVNLLLWMVT